MRLPIELATLHTDPIFRNRHAQILHRENRPTLPRPTRTTTSKARPLNTQVSISLVTLPTVAARSGRSACTGRSVQARCGGKTADGVVGGGAVGGADARELVGVGGDI